MKRKWPPEGTYDNLTTEDLVEAAEEHTDADTGFHCEPWNGCYPDCLESFKRRMRQALWDAGWTPDTDQEDDDPEEHREGLPVDDDGFIESGHEAVFTDRETTSEEEAREKARRPIVEQMSGVSREKYNMYLEVYQEQLRHLHGTFHYQFGTFSGRVRIALGEMFDFFCGWMPWINESWATLERSRLRRFHSSIRREAHEYAKQKVNDELE